MVSDSSARNGVTRSSGPMTTPVRDSRATAVHRIIAGSSGVTAKSL